MNGLIHRDVSRHVEESSAGPHRGVQSGKTIEVRIDLLEQILLNQFAMLGQQIGNRAEDDTFVFPLLIEFTDAVTATVERRNTPRQINALVEHCFWQTFGRRFGLKRELVQLEQANVGPHPLFLEIVGPIEFVELRPSRFTLLGHPRRLAERFQELIEAFVGEGE